MTTKHVVQFKSSQHMEQVDDGSIDLIVTSPPYPMIEMWDKAFRKNDPRIGESIDKNNGQEAFEFMHQLLDKVWDECARVVRPGGFMCVNIGDATRKVGDNFRMYTNHSRVINHCESLGFQSLPAILWRKQTNSPNKFMGSGMLPSGAYVTLEHEYILILRKGNKRSFTGKARDARQSSAFFWEERNVWFSDIWDLKGTKQVMSNNDARTRSAAYPFELAHRLVNMYSAQGDTVLDPFLGTGTTLVACLAGARNSVGYEMDQALAPIVSDTVANGVEVANLAVNARLASHSRFVEDIEAKRGTSLRYVNTPYGFRVMTKQEVMLRLFKVQAIRKDAGGVFIASHTMAHPGNISPVVIDGLDDSRAKQQQLALGFGD